jgi:diadenylate cyclase
LRDVADEILNLFHNFSVLDVLDIVLVAFIIYKVLMLIRGTRAWRIVVGGAFFILLLLLSSKFHFTTLHWLLDKAAVLLPVALVILLMPELRQLLEGMGRLPILNHAGDETEVRTIEEIVASTAELSASRVGALIVIERTNSLEDVISTGVNLSARVSAPLLGSIFYEGNPLHDGAVVIRGDTLLSAACRLPLSESRRVIDRTLHMRHLAAIGVSEAFDCITIVVSEERGTISFTAHGEIYKLNGPGELRDILHREVRGQNPPRKSKSLISFRSREAAEQ